MSRRDPLLSLYLVSLIGALGFSIVLPFLVFLIEDFGGNAFVYGLVGATYPTFQFVGAPVLGVGPIRWVDARCCSSARSAPCCRG